MGRTAQVSGCAALLGCLVASAGCAPQVSSSGTEIQITWAGGTEAQHDRLTHACGLPAPDFRADTAATRRDPTDPFTSTYALPHHGQGAVTAATVRACLGGSPLVTGSFGGVTTLA